MFDLSPHIKEWKEFLKRGGKLTQEDRDELESHLLDEMEGLQKAGLNEEEAFFIAVKRLGRSHELVSEYDKVNTRALWEQHAVFREKPAFQEIMILLGSALLAVVLSKIPALLGREDSILFSLNAGLAAVVPAGIYFLLQRQVNKGILAVYFALFLGSFLFVHFLPFGDSYQAQSWRLTAFLAPICLWFSLEPLYGRWGPDKINRRMHFLEFTGEAFIYGVLIILGGSVLVLFILVLFENTLNIKRVNDFIRYYVILFGGVAAPLVASYLADGKKGRLENIAPVLARLFIPLFTALLLIFLVVLGFNLDSLGKSRDVLILFDVLLLLILAMVIYSASARKKKESAGPFDYLSIALILLALLSDIYPAWEMIRRMTEYGVTPNKVTGLSANVLLFANLAGMAWHYIRFVSGKSTFRALERFQSFFTAIYPFFLGFIAFALPLIFQFK